MPVVMTKHYTLFQFDELSDAAKEKAREWFRTDYPDHDWWDSVYETADRAAEILGITLERKGRDTPAIYFSGFWSQGDGACFEGSYRYKKGWRKELWSEFGGEALKELDDLGRELQQTQQRFRYQLEATCRHRGRYQHSGCMSVEVSHAESLYRDIGNAEDEIRDALRSFADWIYKTLEREYDWLVSDEQVDESIRANEYTFLEDGTREG